MRHFAYSPMAFALGVLALLGLAACGTTPPAPTRTFLLNPGPPVEAAHQFNGSVQVAFVDADPPFNAGEFQYRLSNAQWETDPYNRFLLSPSEMMTGILRDWLRGSKQFTAVALPGTGGGQPYLVAAELTNLSVDFETTDAPVAKIQWIIRVTQRSNDGESKVLLRRAFSASSPVDAKTPDAFVTAWNAALRSLLVDLTGALRASKPDAR